jgi:hypothetical protein
VKKCNRIVCLATLMCLPFFSITAHAQATIDTNGNYHGTIQGVAVGFFGNVGVGFPSPTTCAGTPAAVLLTSNPQYNSILALLLTAQATGADVNINTLPSVVQTFGGAAYCIITAASLGEFVYW